MEATLPDSNMKQITPFVTIILLDMRIIRLLAACAAVFLSLPLNAQVNNFSISQDGKAYWQKVYDTNLEYDDLLNTINNNGQFIDVVDGDVITFRVVRAKLDFKKLGYSRGSIPIYAAGSDVSCFVTVQIKEGRYRITADNIILTENTTGGLLKEGTENPIETWAVRNGEITKAFSKGPSQLYDKFFSGLFLLEGKSYIDNEW